MYTFLRKIPMFSDLSDVDLNAMCRWVEEARLAPGEMLFPEGSKGDRAYIIQDGEVEIVKSSGNREVLLSVRGSGEVIGEMSLLEDAPRMASVRGRTPVTLLAIGQDQFNELLRNSPSAARAMLHTITARLRVTETMLRQSEKLGQLGTLSAGVAHELNNPSAAVARGVGQLRDASKQLHQLFLYPRSAPFNDAQLDVLRQIDATVQERAGKPPALDPLACSDLEYELETWMGDHGVDNGWEYAGTLVSVGFDLRTMEDLAACFEGEQLRTAVAWIAGTYNIYNLLDSVGRGAAHIADIVKSLKTYVFLDQAPVQEIDIHEGLDNTLAMMRNKARPGLRITLNYGDNVSRMQAYGSELNQVWTSVLENALYAVGDEGEIVITTKQKGDWITVEIEDSGTGIPKNVLPKIFDPFFTTKPPGHGSGMGLPIAYNTVVEKPRGADDMLRQILTTSKNIAVVGISPSDDRPSHTVPAYLQKQGYTILPVNPNADEVLGEQCYPDLQSVPQPIDVVLIFRPNDA